MESYICKHCGANLDGGDIFEHFMLEYRDHVRALKSAKAYGWTEKNRLHFSKFVTVQPDKGQQYEICPQCKERR
jgi:DNA-directed RNA polymerase subunit RPC12/RpoP